MCPILFALLFFLLLFALFFSASVVLFVGQRQKQITKLFFVFFCFWLRYLRLTQCVSLYGLEKRLKKMAQEKFSFPYFWRQFSSTRKAFLTGMIFFFIINFYLEVFFWIFSISNNCRISCNRNYFAILTML